MYGTLGRLRFYVYCDLSPFEVDYVIPLQDYPEYPRAESLDMYMDVHKSALGSNHWVYPRGTSARWDMSFIEVSDDCAATFGMIIGSSFGYAPHVVIYEGPGIDGITFGSLMSVTDPAVVKGTYFPEMEEWAPREVNFGLWNFDIKWRKE